MLDTNICIYFIKGMFDLNVKIKEVGIENCFISEITMAELKYGAEKSEYVEKNRESIKTFEKIFKIIAISSSIDVFAKEKARLKKEGRIKGDFDLLIGATAISNDLILVTRNIKDFEQLNNIKIQDWTK